MTETSIWHLITNASLTVQLVMFLLLAASVASWTLIIHRYKFLKNAKSSLQKFENQFWSGIELNELYTRLTRNENSLTGINQIFNAGFKEYLMVQNQDTSPDKKLDSIQRAMKVALSREIEHLEQHLSFLATVGSTSPYVGLFGTVWGIMTSFRALSSASQASIAMVAPGISEALIATAMGLFAAIPAVIAYNRFANQADNLIGKYQTFQEEFYSLLDRQIYAGRKRP